MSIAELEAMLAQLRQEFLDGCEDRFNEMDGAILNLLDNKGDADENLMDLLRQLHSIKGTAGTHDLQAMSTIAHAAEDYMEATKAQVSEQSLKDIQAYVDSLRHIVDKRLSPNDQETAAIIKGLPKAGASAEAKQLTALLVMPSGTQRRFIANELAEHGLRLTMSDNGLGALGVVLSREPDFVLASMELDDMTGSDLARAMNGIQKCKATPFILLTAYEPNDPRLGTLPKTAVCLHKDDTLTKRLYAQLAAWGLS